MLDGFTGRPSLPARVGAPTMRVLRAITGLAGIDLGTGINTLLARRRPARRLTRALTLRHRDFRGWDLCTLSPAAPSDRLALAIHGGAFVCEATVLHWRDYAALARKRRQPSSYPATRSPRTAPPAPSCRGWRT